MISALEQRPRIAIVGGGPVGLMTAVLLHRHGVLVTVYERDASPDARISGGTLDLHRGTGQRALQEAGLLEAFYRLARPTSERAADHHGAILMEETPNAENCWDRPEIDRQDLRRLLLSALPADRVTWNSRLIDLEDDPHGEGGFRLRFEGGWEAWADLIVGADGGRSRVRPYVGGMLPRYTGTFVIQGEIRHPRASCPDFCALHNGGNLMARGEGMMLFAQTRADGSTNYYVSFRRPENWLDQAGVQATDLAATKRLLRTTLHHWHPAYHQAVNATETFAFLPMRRLPLVEESRQVPRAITLVGDAAHLMPPFAGVGVNIGLVDALELSTGLTRCDGTAAGLTHAIAEYEAKMRRYAREAQEDTARAELDIHSEIGVTELLAERDEHNRAIVLAAED